MYYPKQLPYLLDQEFKKNIEYREYKSEKLSDYIMCIWSMKSKKISKKTIYNYILPDASIDIVIDLTNKTIQFAGFSNETIPFVLENKIEYLGVRLKPGSFYFLFNIESNKIMDHPFDIFRIEKETDLKKIFQTKERKQQIKAIERYILTKIKKDKDKKYIQMIDELYKNPNKQTVEELAKKLGYDKRHMFRIFKKQYGVSPKVLLNIIRLHLCLTLLLEEKKSIQEIMHRCDFYDQSHFIKEIKKYTGYSPLELIERNW